MPSDRRDFRITYINDNGCIGSFLKESKYDGIADYNELKEFCIGVQLKDLSSGEIVKKFMKKNKKKLNEASISNNQGADDGPSFMYPSVDIYKRASAKDLERYIETGWSILSHLIDDDRFEVDVKLGELPNMADDRTKAVSYFPAGDLDSNTPANQENIYGREAYRKWKEYIMRSVTQLGWEWLWSREQEEDYEQAVDDTENLEVEKEKETEREKEQERQMKGENVNESRGKNTSQIEFLEDQLKNMMKGYEHKEQFVDVVKRNTQYDVEIIRNIWDAYQKLSTDTKAMMEVGKMWRDWLNMNFGINDGIYESINEQETMSSSDMKWLGRIKKHVAGVKDSTMDNIGKYGVVFDDGSSAIIDVSRNNVKLAGGTRSQQRDSYANDLLSFSRETPTSAGRIVNFLQEARLSEKNMKAMSADIFKKQVKADKLEKGKVYQMPNKKKYKFVKMDGDNAVLEPINEVLSGGMVVTENKADKIARQISRQFNHPEDLVYVGGGMVSKKTNDGNHIVAIALQEKISDRTPPAMREPGLEVDERRTIKWLVIKVSPRGEVLEILKEMDRQPDSLRQYTNESVEEGCGKKHGTDEDCGCPDCKDHDGQILHDDEMSEDCGCNENKSVILEINDGHVKIDNGTVYGDTNFVQNSDGMLDGTLKHMGFGEFYLDTPQGEIQFVRTGKDLPNFSGRVHRVEDSKGGELVKQLVTKMVQKGKAVREIKENINENIEVFDERVVGNKRIVVMNKDGRTRTAVMTKDKMDRFNRNKQEDLQKLWDLAKKYKGKEIKEARLTEKTWVVYREDNNKMKVLGTTTDVDKAEKMKKDAMRDGADRAGYWTKKQFEKMYGSVNESVAGFAGKVGGHTISEKNPCWEGYVQVGMKEQNGKQVPNCVPKDEVNEFLKESKAFKGLLKETKFYVWYDGQKYEVDAKDISSAKKEFVQKHNVPMSKWGRIAIKSAKSMERGEFRFENTLSEAIDKVDDRWNIWRLSFDGYPHYLRKIDSTHFFMANSKDALQQEHPNGVLVQHIAQHRDSQYYRELENWLDRAEEPVLEYIISSRFDNMITENDIKKRIISKAKKRLNERVEPTGTMSAILQVANSRQGEKVNGTFVDSTTAHKIAKVWDMADDKNKKKMNSISDPTKLAKVADVMVK